MSHTLTITRDIPTADLKICLYRAWTEPQLLEQWFCPKPWRAHDFEIDLRPGGRFNCIMSGPDGEKFPNKGSFLEIIPNEKIVFTSVFSEDWKPVPGIFQDLAALPMVATVTFEEIDENTLRYTARVDHWSEADYQRHADMGFEAGWNTALDQLIELSRRG